MKINELRPNMIVSISGHGDLGMTHRKWINKTGFFIKQCRSGLIQVAMTPKIFIVVPLRNIRHAETK